MELLHIIAGFVISLGVFFLLIGSVGLIRLPDFYSRTHATGKSDTLGVMLVVAGIILTQVESIGHGGGVNIMKLLLIIAFVGLTNPTATNALAKAAYKMRLMPWFKDDKSANNKKK